MVQVHRTTPTKHMITREEQVGSKDYHRLMRQLLPRTKPDLKQVAQHLLPFLVNELLAGVVEELRSRNADDKYTYM